MANDVKFIPGGELYMQELKHRVELSMNKIDTVDPNQWHHQRKLLNEFDFCSRRLGVNRACYKLWELCKFFPQLIENPSVTGHFGEAPGSFVQVIHKLYPECKIVAVSKPPSLYSEVLKNSKTTPKFSTNVMKIKQAEFIYMDLLNVTKLSKFVLRYNQFDFLTADGGLSEGLEYDKKEALHLDLILAEVVSILLTLKINGNCIIKVFDIFSETMIHILWLLAKHFLRFEYNKPTTSRPTNSENYLVCFGYKGTFHSTESLYSLLDNHIKINMKTNQSVPDWFYQQTLNSTKLIAENQIKTINAVIDVIRSKEIESNTKRDQIIKYKKKVFKDFVERYDLTISPS